MKTADKLLQELNEAYEKLLEKYQHNQGLQKALESFKQDLTKDQDIFLNGQIGTASAAVTPLASTPASMAIGGLSLTISTLTVALGGTIATKVFGAAYNKYKLVEAQNMINALGTANAAQIAEAFRLQAILYHHARITRAQAKNEEGDFIDEIVEVYNEMAPAMFHNKENNLNHTHLRVELIALFLEGLTEATKRYKNSTHPNFIQYMANLPKTVTEEALTPALNFEGRFDSLSEDDRYRVSLDAMRLSLLVYEDKSLIDERATQWGYKESDHSLFYKLKDDFTDGSMRCVVFSDENTVLCMLRGPKGWVKSAKNFLNIKQSSLDSLYEDFQKHFTAHLKNKNINRVLFTGHGVGGAFALAVGARFLKEETDNYADKVTIITFGQPMVNYIDTPQLQNCVYRFVHEDDARSIWPANLPAALKGHVGKQYLLPNEKQIFNWEHKERSYTDLVSINPSTMQKLRTYHNALAAHARSHGILPAGTVLLDNLIEPWEMDRDADELISFLNTFPDLDKLEKRALQLGDHVFSPKFKAHGLKSQYAILKYFSYVLIKILLVGRTFKHPIENSFARLNEVISTHTQNINKNINERSLKLEILVESHRLCWWLKLAVHLEFCQGTAIFHILKNTQNNRSSFNQDDIEHLETSIKNNPIFSTEDVAYVPLAFMHPLLHTQNTTAETFSNYNTVFAANAHWIITATLIELEFLKVKTKLITMPEQLITRYRTQLHSEQFDLFKKSEILQEWILEDFDHETMTKENTVQLLGTISDKIQKIKFENNQHITDADLLALVIKLPFLETITLINCSKVELFPGNFIKNLTGVNVFNDWLTVWLQKKSDNRNTKTLIIKNCDNLNQECLTLLEKLKVQYPFFNMIITQSTQSMASWNIDIINNFAIKYPECGIHIPSLMPALQSVNTSSELYSLKLPNGACVEVPPQSPGKNVPGALFALMPDNNLLIALPDGTLNRWKINGEKDILIQKLQAHSKKITTITLLSNGQLLTASEDGRLCCWTLLNGELSLTHTFIKLDTASVTFLSGLKDGSFLIHSEERQRLTRWRIEDGQLRHLHTHKFKSVEVISELETDRIIAINEENIQEYRVQGNNITAHSNLVNSDKIIKIKVLPHNILIGETATGQKKYWKSATFSLRSPDNYADLEACKSHNARKLLENGKITKEQIALLFSSELKNLDVSNTQITDEQLDWIRDHCPQLKLKDININNCYFLSEKTRVLKKILDNIDGDPKVIHTLELEGHSLTDSEVLTLITNNFCQLRTLTLTSFNYFTANEETLSQLEKQGLTNLTLVQCENIDWFAIKKRQTGTLICNIDNAYSDKKIQAESVFYPEEKDVLINPLTLANEIECIKTKAGDTLNSGFIITQQGKLISSINVKLTNSSVSDTISVMQLSSHDHIYVGTASGSLYSYTYNSKGECTESNTLGTCNSNISAVIKIPGGNLVTGNNNELLLWEPKDNSEANHQLSGERFTIKVFANFYTASISALAVLSNGDLVAGLSDGKIIRYSFENHKLIEIEAEIQSATEDPVLSPITGLIAFPENILVSITNSGIIATWQLKNNRLIKKSQINTQLPFVRAIGSLDGSIWCLSKHGALQQWQCMSYENIAYIQDDINRHLHNAKQLLLRHALSPTQIDAFFSSHCTQTFNVSNTLIDDTLLTAITSKCPQLKIIADNCPALSDKGMLLARSRAPIVENLPTGKLAATRWQNPPGIKPGLGGILQFTTTSGLKN